LPNSGDLAAQALAHASYPTSASIHDRSIIFNLTQKSTVSLGFVCSINSPGAGGIIVFIDKVELFKLVE